MKMASGYTLLELMVGLAVLASTMVLFILPSLLHSDEEVLSRELLLLRESLYFLQQKALATGLSQEMEFHTLQNFYQYRESKKNIQHKLEKPIRFGFIPGVTGSPGHVNGIISQAVNFANKKNFSATAYPDGRISCGSIYLTNQSRTCMGALTTPPHQLAHIRLYRWHGDSWLRYQT